MHRTDGIWINAAAIPGRNVASGNTLSRRSDNRCMAKPHEVINELGAKRYAVPFFLDAHWN